MRKPELDIRKFCYNWRHCSKTNVSMLGGKCALSKKGTLHYNRHFIARNGFE